MTLTPARADPLLGLRECAVAGCGVSAARVSADLCETCLARWKDSDLGWEEFLARPRVRRPRGDRPCQVPGCPRPGGSADGLCRTHQGQRDRHPGPAARAVAGPPGRAAPALVRHVHRGLVRGGGGRPGRAVPRALRGVVPPPPRAPRRRPGHLGASRQPGQRRRAHRRAARTARAGGRGAAGGRAAAHRRRAADPAGHDPLPGEPAARQARRQRAGPGRRAEHVHPPLRRGAAAVAAGRAALRAVGPGAGAGQGRVAAGRARASRHAGLHRACPAVAARGSQALGRGRPAAAPGPEGRRHGPGHHQRAGRRCRSACA